MSLPENDKIIDISSVTDKDGNLSIVSPKSYYKLPFYVTAFYEEGEFTKFVKNIEKDVRKSDEYSTYLWNLRNLGLESCSFLGNVNDENATIEFHHYPFTLYDIVATVVEKRLYNKEHTSTFLVAAEVLKLHFDNKVGLIPLSTTVHELVHAGEIFINLNQVYGNFQQFVNEYEKYIPLEAKNAYNKVVEASKNDIEYSGNDILKYKGTNKTIVDEAENWSPLFAKKEDMTIKSYPLYVILLKLLDNQVDVL